MVSTVDDEYTSRFLELLSYVPYLKDEKVKIQRFITRLLAAYKDWINFMSLALDNF